MQKHFYFTILIGLTALVLSACSSTQSDQSVEDPTTTQLSYQVDNGQIKHNGEVIHLFGVNWFGFETTDYVVHGLWEVDYQETIQQMKDLGFNAVRLPFCPTTLQAEASSISYSGMNENLEDLNSLELLDIIMEELNSQQMYILLDHHRPDCNAISELWYTDSYSEDQWIADLVFVAERYQDLEYFMGIDLKNEPHTAATWADARRPNKSRPERTFDGT